MDDVINHTAAVVSAYVSRNAVPAAELPALIASVHAALRATDKGEWRDAENARWKALGEVVKQEPAVPVAKSVHRDYVVCLEDGKKFRSMKRHLNALGLTEAEYKAKWGLPDSYSIVCASYSEKRSALAKKASLGRRRAA